MTLPKKKPHNYLVYRGGQLEEVFMKKRTIGAILISACATFFWNCGSDSLTTQIPV